MTTEQNLDKRRIAKNTLLLYVRMFLMILIGLYTSRVILKTLGVSDYGVYNVVGGMVSMFAFLNSAMVAASQRFISYELGRGDKERLNLVFCTSVNIHVIIAVVIFILAETIGLWFVNIRLVIDADRMVAANWVYQFSVLTFMVTVVSVPYNSCIVAHEHMRAFAYKRIKISTFAAVIKNSVIMYSSSDFEHLFIRYKAEAMPQGESIQDFCFKNKVPYNLFQKWYKDTRHHIVPV